MLSKHCAPGGGSAGGLLQLDELDTVIEDLYDDTVETKVTATRKVSANSIAQCYRTISLPMSSPNSLLRPADRE